MTTTPDPSVAALEANKEAASPSPWWVSVLYGDFGSRKTTTACSMIDKRGLLISADDSWKVLLNKRHEEIYSKTKVIDYQSISQLDHINFDDYDTTIIDPISEAVDRYLDLLHDHAKWGGNLRDTIMSQHPELKGTQVVGFPDYRATRDKFRPIIRRLLQESNTHVIFTSHMTIPIKGMGDQKVRPSIPDATLKLFATRADVIAQLSGSGAKFHASVEQNMTQLGKSRIETIQGKMDLDSFVKAYKERVFQ